MRTSKEWWQETRSDPAGFRAWLVKQHRGEVTAADRIGRLAESLAPGDRRRRTLSVIAGQERRHSEWVLALLRARGVEPDPSGAEERYWREAVPAAPSFEAAAAVGAHAEAMRLERIREIASDESADEDVRSAFGRILRDELFHERAFREMAGPEAMSAAEPAHRAGTESLGLQLLGLHP